MTIIDPKRGAGPPVADSSSRGSFKDRMWNNRPRSTPRSDGNPQVPRSSPRTLDNPGIGPDAVGPAAPRGRGPRIGNAGVDVRNAVGKGNWNGWDGSCNTWEKGWNDWNGSCSWSGSCGWPSWPGYSWNRWGGSCFNSSFWFGGGNSGLFIGFGLWPWAWSWCDPWWPSYSYSWPGPRYSYWDTWGYTPVSSASYTTIYVPQSYAQAGAPPPCPATLAEAWEMLTDGNAAGAQAHFECLSNQAPGDGLALVGLATASAIRKDDVLAVDAMRRALREDPESLSLVSTDERLTILLADATTRFQERARKQYGDVDALVMTGALCYLRREMAEAHYAVEVALALDAADVGARNLQGLIERQ